MPQKNSVSGADIPFSLALISESADISGSTGNIRIAAMVAMENKEIVFPNEFNSYQCPQEVINNAMKSMNIIVYKIFNFSICHTGNN